MSGFAIFGWATALVISLLAFRLAPRDMASRPHLISTHGVVIVLFLTYMILPAADILFLRSGQFFWAASFGGAKGSLIGISAVNGALILFLLGYTLGGVALRFKVPRSVNRNHLSSADSLSVKRERLERLIALTMVLIGVAMKLLAVHFGGGSENTLVRMSGGVSEYVGIGGVNPVVGHLRNFSGIAEAGACWLLIKAFISHRNRLLATLLLLAVISISILITGKRLYILWPLLILALTISRYMRPLRPRDLLLFFPLIIAFGFASLMYRIFMPAASVGLNLDLDHVEWAQGSMWLFYSRSLELASFELSVAAIEARNEIISIFGGLGPMLYRTHLEPFLFPIPRAIWGGKPEALVDISHALASITVTGDYSFSRFGVAPTLIGTSWVSGGIVGFILAFILMGWFCRRLDRGYLKGWQRLGEIMRVITFSFALIVVFHTFRQGTLGWIFMISVFQQAGMLIGFAILARVSRPPRHTLVPSPTGS